MSCRAGDRASRPEGFSLLEVILALAILTGAIATLGEVVRMGMRNARVARDLTQAQLLCESKMAEITSGFTPAESVFGASFDTVTTGSQNLNSPTLDLEDWIYSIETEMLDQDGLMAVAVTVAQDLPAEQRPVQFRLVRWMIDPTAVGTTTQASTASSTEEP